MSVGGFFLLLFISILLRYIGNKIIPVFMPPKRLRSWGVGMLGGFLGSFADKIFLGIGPEIAKIYLLGAILGSSLFILLYGLAPFLRILFFKK